MDFELARFHMIEQQIRPWDVLDASVLHLLSRVRREEFVPADQRALAFMDTELPLPEGQRMLAPRVEARLLQELRLTGTERVLEIGTGSGFMACLLAGLSREVVSLEIRPGLAEWARGNLHRAKVHNVVVELGDGSALGAGAPATGHLAGPFDAIVLSGSVAEEPRALLSLLNPGGRLVVVQGQEPVMQACRYTRNGNQAFERTVLFDTVTPRLQGFPEPSRFTF